MTLNLDAGGNATGMDGNPGGKLAPKKPSGLSLGLPLEINAVRGSADLVDVELPLERQGWVLVGSLFVVFRNIVPAISVFLDRESLMSSR